MPTFRVVAGCPCNPTLAPYIEILRRDTGATINSIYRGADARAILHKHGKRDQAELYANLPRGVANPPGRSTHELRSDGAAYPGPVGRKLEWWQQGWDVNDGDVKKVIAAAKARGWTIVQPYKAGVEYHHLNFARKPRPQGPRTAAKLIALRAMLPRS